MGISVEDAVKELQARETVFVAYSQATKLPYVTCGEETYNDQVWFFAEEETLKEYGKKKLEDKILLMGMRYEKKDFPRMYGLLFSIGVNSVIWNNGADEIEIDLEKIVRKPDLSQMEPAKRPLINPTLQLSGIYFMQELRRPVEKEEHKNLRALEEELIANLKKSHFLVAMERDEENPKKINIPYLKNKEGQILQPVFSDVMEFEKFAKGKKLRLAKIPFNKLPEILINQAEAMVFNPMGFNLILNKEVERRTRNLVSELQKRHIHQDVIKCCKEEYLQENYFHAVFEAAKSLSEKVREKTGMQEDGSNLFNNAFAIHISISTTWSICLDNSV